MKALSPNATGALYMVIGSLGYVINDALVRRTTENGPGVYQVLFLRSVGLALLFAVLGIVRRERTTRAHLKPLVLGRVVAEVLGSALFFAAVVRMEFANAQAILQIVPFAVTLAAAVVLKERVTGLQYLAILAGFVGVLIVVRPATDGFSAWSLMAVASALLIVLRELATRDVAQEIPAGSIAFVTAVGLAGLTGVITLVSGWQPISGHSAALIGAAIGFLAFGYVFTIQTVRVGDLSVSAPFRYSLLLGAVIIGYVAFGEAPDALTIIGSVVIVAGGLLAIQLERSRHLVDR